MSNLISKEEAIKAIISESLKDGAYGYMDTKSIIDLLNDLTSTQPEITVDGYADGFADGYKQGQKDTQPERKTGKWISTDDGWDGEYFVCSVCGCPWTLIEGTPEDNGMNFCPNCGADMKGEADGR